jgi:hypothetical protein
MPVEKEGIEATGDPLGVVIESGLPTRGQVHRGRVADGVHPRVCSAFRKKKS